MNYFFSKYTWVVNASNMNYFFSKYTFFLILKLCLAPVFNFFPLSDLKYNLSQISEKIGFFREKSDFFGKMSEFFRFFPKNRRFFPEIFLNDFSMVFSSPLQSITEKSPKYRPIFPIFSSLMVTMLLFTEKVNDDEIYKQLVHEHVIKFEP